MLAKRLNIMLYSPTSGEQIILPVNPSSIEIKYEKSIESFDVLGFGQVNIMGNPEPVRIRLSHFLPEDDSIFGTNAGIIYGTEGSMNSIEYTYSSDSAVSILKKWAIEKYKIRLVIDDEINMECMVVSFSETLRESTAIKPYTIELLEYRNPSSAVEGLLGLITRSNTLLVPKTILMKSADTVYSIANKYGLDFKTLASNNGIDDVNANIEGTKLSTQGA